MNASLPAASLETAPERPPSPGLAAPATALFDRLEHVFHGRTARRAVAWILIGAFFASLALIELARHGLGGPRLAAALPRTHFHAIELVFYLLLSYEVVGLVFAIAQSVANAAGKQFEIFSLILLRRSFEAFAGLDEPLRWTQVHGALEHMLSDALGALLIFVALGFYYAQQKHRPLSGNVSDRASFIAAKKVIALALLVVLFVMGARSLWGLLVLLEPHPFFEAFYTLLIFADVLVVLISLRYSSSYHVVFRNSGLAVATVLLRVALAAPPPWSAVLGLVAVVFALALTLAYNRFAPAT
ncbi:MAG TPA: hypothetical protein VFK85_13505 [Anaeromyxobacteraceae bacterium]|nr:hypothetical protein [Anaeromyxobacteraceae bacterium]